RTLAEQMLPTSDILAKLASATDPRALVLLRAHILIALESQIGVEHWRKPTDLSQNYLRAIEAHGYILADIERRAAGLDPLAEQYHPFRWAVVSSAHRARPLAGCRPPARMAVDRGIEPRSTAPARPSLTHHKRIKKQPHNHVKLIEKASQSMIIKRQWTSTWGNPVKPKERRNDRLDRHADRAHRCALRFWLHLHPRGRRLRRCRSSAHARARLRCARR